MEEMEKFDQALIEYAESVLDDKQSHKKDYQGMEIIIANLPLIYDKLVAGETISDICKSLGISRSTWYKLAGRNIHFRKLLENAEAEQISQVKKNLVNKCSDRYIQRQKVLPNGRIVEYEDFLPADINAIKFYLLNKAPEEFKEKQEIVVKRKEYIIDIIDTDYQVVEDGEEGKDCENSK